MKKATYLILFILLGACYSLKAQFPGAAVMPDCKSKIGVMSPKAEKQAITIWLFLMCRFQEH